MWHLNMVEAIPAEILKIFLNLDGAVNMDKQQRELVFSGQCRHLFCFTQSHLKLYGFLWARCLSQLFTVPGAVLNTAWGSLSVYNFERF